MKKSVIIVIVACFYLLVGKERALPEECIGPLKQYDELIDRTDITDNERKQLMILRHQLVSEAKNARTAHFIMLTCIGAYDKIKTITEQLDHNRLYNLN